METLTSALTAIGSDGTFATQISCPTDGLNIKVDTVGSLRLPISSATAKTLCAAGGPAPFGRGTKTLHDKSVRDTFEISKAQLEIGGPSWKRTLDLKLSQIQRRLGLPVDGTLKATFDKMLVYGPGQFFAPHRDSERHDTMIGSLIVELPSQYTGGALLVEHHGKNVELKWRPRDGSERHR